MLWVIVAVVVVGAIFAFGTLVGSSVAQNLAGDRVRRDVREQRVRRDVPEQRVRSTLSARAVIGEPLTHP